MMWWSRQLSLLPVTTLFIFHSCLDSNCWLPIKINPILCFLEVHFEIMNDHAFCSIWVNKAAELKKKNPNGALMDWNAFCRWCPLYSWPQPNTIRAPVLHSVCIYMQMHTRTGPQRYGDELLLLCLHCSFKVELTPHDCHLIRGFRPWANRPQRQRATPRLLIIIITITLP